MSEVRATTLAQPSKLSAYITLTKPDVSFLVLMTTGAGYYMGARGPIGWLHMIHVIVATMMIAAGTAALNHYIERESDRLHAPHSLAPAAHRRAYANGGPPLRNHSFAAGGIDLYLTAGFWPCFLGVFTCLSYLLAYTPLKKRTVWATFIGAIPGAIPPMIGWTAATGKVDAGAWLLFAILSSGNFRISTQSPGCTAKITPAPESSCIPVVDKEGQRTSVKSFSTPRLSLPSACCPPSWALPASSISSARSSPALASSRSASGPPTPKPTPAPSGSCTPPSCTSRSCWA